MFLKSSVDIAYHPIIPSSIIPARLHTTPNYDAGLSAQSTSANRLRVLRHASLRLSIQSQMENVQTRLVYALEDGEDAAVTDALVAFVCSVELQWDELLRPA